MTTVTVLYNIESKPVKENLKRELRWYDTIKQEMQIFEGGQLGFEYKEDEYLVAMGEEERKNRGITTTFRMLPKVEDLEVVNYNNVKTTDNEKEVKKWFGNYTNYNDSDATVVSSDRYGIEFNVPDKEVDDFLYNCERNGFRTRR